MFFQVLIKNCMFSLKTGRTIPVYLVDEEIYAKCPTVIISTVDKFARLPWSERVGLLFGRTDRYCSRCGHIAIGEKHAGRHNADVAAGLERAETVACYDVVIATNMIAVGMDVDRLGLMSVVGQPKQNSEYIQATSRVGRQHPGIIFTVYNPYRPRDLSNYENFVGFHSQMYRYVEGTTATPFAARARDRVLHALVVSLLRLQVETMADNGGASNINDISDEQIKDIKDKILERVKIIAPSSYVDTEKEMDELSAQ